MERSRGVQKRGALRDFLLDGDPIDEADDDEAVGVSWDDADLEDVGADAGLDDQDLEIARLLGRDV